MSLPVLHLVTDDRVLADPAFPRRAASALEAGGPSLALHLRGPGTDGGPLFRLAARLLPVARAAGAWVVVNDRIDVAGCAGAHGVQLGQRSLPLAVARRLIPGTPVGVSVHSPEEARDAAGADWLVVGTLFATPSHPGQPGAGAGILGRIAAAAPHVPLVGIGGVTPERLPLLREAGAHGFAVLRGVWEDEAPASAVGRYLSAWQDTETVSGRREAQGGEG